MDHKALAKDLPRLLRGKRTQKQLSREMGFDFNQVYRWESGRTLMSWKNFIDLCRVCQVKLEPALKECFSFSQRPSDTGSLIRHFVGHRLQQEVANELGVSRSSLSRWMKGSQTPNLVQILKLMHVGSIDFFRFIESLTGGIAPSSLKEELVRELAHLKLYETYPWLSVLLSALDLDAYRDEPTVAFLARKSKLPPASIKDAIADLHAQDLLHWSGRHWETKLKRIALRGSVDSRREIARYVWSRAMDGLDPGFGTTKARYSWKTFSLNQKNFDLLHEWSGPDRTAGKEPR